MFWQGQANGNLEYVSIIASMQLLLDTDGKGPLKSTLDARWLVLLWQEFVVTIIEIVPYFLQR